jgi:spore germination cell wall hydrolase CwlJ-like protein
VSTPAWAKELQKTKVIGKHHFYKWGDLVWKNYYYLQYFLLS